MHGNEGMERKGLKTVGLCEVDLKALTDSVEKLGGGSFGRR
jgi:hypothetical protein